MEEAAFSPLEPPTSHDSGGKGWLLVLRPPVPHGRGWPRAPAAPVPAQAMGKSIESVLRPPPAPRSSVVPYRPDIRCPCGTLETLPGECWKPISWEPDEACALAPRPPSGRMSRVRRPRRRAASEGLDGARGDSPPSTQERTPRQHPLTPIVPRTPASESLDSTRGSSPRSVREWTATREGSMGRVLPLTARECRDSRRTPIRAHSNSARRASRETVADGNPERRQVASRNTAESLGLRPATSSSCAPSQRQPLSQDLGTSSSSQSELHEAVTRPWTSEVVSLGAAATASRAPTGPSAGFLALLEEMQSETKMWEEKTLGLLSGTDERPSGMDERPRAIESRPSAIRGPLSTAVGHSENRNCQKDMVDTTSSVRPGEVPVTTCFAAATSFVDDALEAALASSEMRSGSWAEPEGHSPSLQSEEEAEPDPRDSGGSRIAAALRAMGMEPSHEAIVELVKCDEDGRGEAETGCSAPARWANSPQRWAAERARRKKERCGLRSGAGTPVSAALGKTPCSSSGHFSERFSQLAVVSVVDEASL